MLIYFQGNLRLSSKENLMVRLINRTLDLKPEFHFDDPWTLGKKVTSNRAIAAFDLAAITKA